MTTDIVPVNEEYFKKRVFELGKIIREGGLVSFPTETVYGLGANALDAEAARKTYAAKGRPSDNPLIVHVADKKEVSRYVKEVTPLEEKLMDAFWPGPLTIVFPKKDIIPKATSGGLDTIAIRCPANEATRALIRAAGVPQGVFGPVHAPAARRPWNIVPSSIAPSLIAASTTCPQPLRCDSCSAHIRPKASSIAPPP